IHNRLRRADHALPAPADWPARQSIGATGLSIPFQHSIKTSLFAAFDPKQSLVAGDGDGKKCSEADLHALGPNPRVGWMDCDHRRSCGERLSPIAVTRPAGVEPLSSTQTRK